MKNDKLKDFFIKFVGGIFSLVSLWIGFFLLILLAGTGFENSFFTLIMRLVFLIILGIIFYLNINMWKSIKEKDSKKLSFALMGLFIIILIHFDKSFYDWFFNLFF